MPRMLEPGEGNPGARLHYTDLKKMEEKLGKIQDLLTSAAADTMRGFKPTVFNELSAAYEVVEEIKASMRGLRVEDNPGITRTIGSGLAPEMVTPPENPFE